ncbi:MAG: histidine--tRNA ligase [Patescibacteria group bacterium]
MPRRKKEELPREEIKKIKTPPLIDGMRDVLPNDEKYWDFVEESVWSAVRDYSFRRVITPVIEKYDLFAHTIFKQNGQAEKELFSFIDKGQKVTLRPEATASLARSYIMHNMSNQLPPVKLYAWGPMFRQGKVDDNKLRQFQQVSFSIFGDPTPAIDAELIIVAHALLRNLGLETEIRINSLGCNVCRLEYTKALSGYLKAKRGMVCADCRKRAQKEPLKFLTCENAKCQKMREDAPQTIDWLCDDCRNHLFRVLEYLDELKIPYKLDPTLLKTYDYYNKTVFELTALDDKEAVPLGGGGRFDYLTEMLGGVRTPASGFSLGLERVINELKNKKVEIPPQEPPDVFVAQISEQARKQVYAFYEELRKEKKLIVRANFSKGNLKAQLEIATKVKARLLLILGQKEVAEGTIILRDMDSGIQEVINRSRAVREVKKRLRDLKKNEDLE